MNITGLKIDDIISMSPDDISKLNEKELRQITSRLISAGNKRLVRAKPTKTGVYSPAVISVAEAQGVNLEKGEKPRFSISNATTRNQVRANFEQVKNFLKAKTSTAKGFKAYRKEVEKALGVKITSSKERENEFWRAYNRFMIEEKNEFLFKSKGENGVLNWLKEYSENNEIYDADSLHKALKEELLKWEEGDLYEPFTNNFEGVSINPDDINPQKL